MNNDAKTALEKAADDFGYADAIKNSDLPNIFADVHFKAGASWAIKHSPEVLALVDALKFYADGNHYYNSDEHEWIKPGKIGYDDPPEIRIKDIGGVAHDALEEFRAAQGKDG